MYNVTGIGRTADVSKTLKCELKLQIDASPAYRRCLAQWFNSHVEVKQ